MKTDEKELAYIISISKEIPKDDISNFDYFSTIIARLLIETQIKKEKLIELTKQEVGSKYPANLTSITTGFLNFISCNQDGYTIIGEKDIELAKKGVAAFEDLQRIIRAIDSLYNSNNCETLDKIVEDIKNGNGVN